MFDFMSAMKMIPGMGGGLGKAGALMAMPGAGEGTAGTAMPSKSWGDATSVDSGGAFTQGLNGMPNGFGINFNKHLGGAMQGAAEQMPGGYHKPTGQQDPGAFAAQAPVAPAGDENAANVQNFMAALQKRRAMQQGGMR